jgi:hypothetical protein
MSQIEIRILKQGLETTKVISCSFFTMRDAYRDVEKYETYLKNFCSMTRVPGFCVRIYTDDSGKDTTLAIANKHQHVSVYHFNCPDFREEVGHVGTFGTLVRFLPLFEKDLEIVWVSDIDVPSSWFSSVPKQDFNYKTNICYDRKVYGRKYTILAGTMISRVQFPKQLLTKFLNNLAHDKYGDMIEKLNEANTRKPPSKIPYGIDELFTNTAIYNYLIRHNVSVSVEYSYITGFERFLTFSGKLTSDEISTLKTYYKYNIPGLFGKVKKIFQKHLEWAVSERPCFKDILTLFPTFKTSFVKIYVLEGKELE